MLDQSFEHFPGEVEPIEACIFAFKLGDDAERLCIVVEATGIRHRGVERTLSGMAEGRVAEIVGERERLGQILVEPEPPRHRARDLGDFQAMSEPRAVVIALVIDEDLGLVVQPPEGCGVQDAVAVAGKRRADRARRLRCKPPAALVSIGSVGRERTAEPRPRDSCFRGKDLPSLASLVD
jgi:hypothetical protein